MKKHILAIIMTLLCLTMMLALVACGDETNGTEECAEHTFGEWKIIKPTNCIMDGKRSRECTVCHFEETEDVPASGHQYGEWEVVVVGTCMRDGESERVCSVCDHTDKAESKANGHDWNDYVTVDSTCTEEGSKSRSCKNCSETESETLEPKGHDWNDEVTVDSTCAKEGSISRSCKNCSEVESETIEKKPHNWTNDGVGWDDEPFYEAPTCTTEGFSGRVCLECGEEDVTELSVIPHEMGAWVVPEGVTCETGGTITRTCKMCGKETEEQDVEPGEHVNVVVKDAIAPTFEADGTTGTTVCEACGTTLKQSFKLPKLSNLANKDNLSVPQGEVWGSFEKKVEYLFDGNKETCPKSPKGLYYTLSFELDKNAYVSSIMVACNGKGTSYDQWSSSNIEDVLYGIVKINIICYNGDEVVKMQEFDTTNLTEVNMQVNANVNRVDIQATATNDTRYGGAYIWEIGVYGTVRVTPCDESGEHKWSDWETVRNAACSQEGLVDGLETRTCSACYDTEEKVLPASHSWGDWDIEGLTCTTGGTKTKTCASCGLVESETVEAGGHLNVVIEGAKDPTFEADGSTGTEKCLACGEVINEAKVITKYENIASSATVTTNSVCWVVKDNLAALTDGNKEYGTGGSHNEGNYNIVFAFDGNKGIKKLVITVNGKGSTAAGKFDTVTNNNYKVEVNMTSADGTVVHSQAYQSGDVTEIVIEPTADVSTITLTVHSGWDNQIAVWEVEAITGGDIVE